MKIRMKDRPVRLTMIEIVFIVSAFSIISVFLLTIFLSANSLQSKARDLSKSVIQAENIAEIIHASDTLEAAMEDIGAIATEDGYIKYFDSNWNAVEGPSLFLLLVKPSIGDVEHGQIMTVDIYINKRSENSDFESSIEEIYHLVTKKYQVAQQIKLGE